MGFFGGGLGPPPSYSYFDNPDGSYSAVNNNFGGSGDTYDDGYLFTSDKTGSQIAGVAGAAGGLGTAITGLFFGNQQAKMQHQMEDIQHQQIRNQFKDRMKTSSEGQIGTLRSYSRELPDMMAYLSAQGQGDSSASKLVKDDADYGLKLRLDSIQRERALAIGGMKAQEQVWQLQRKMERSQRNAAMISAGISTATSLASIASDQRIKKNFGPVDVQNVLEKLDALPIATWTYGWERDNVKHMGPMAQDFHRIFGLGEPIADRPAAIAYVDLFGVLLSAVKALSLKVKELEANQIRR
jgi:hypothetical protein